MSEGRRLEVIELWGETMVDVKTVSAGDDLVTVPEGAVVTVQGRGEPRTLDASTTSFRLAQGASARFTVGPLSFVLRWAARPERLARLREEVDYHFSKVLSVTFLAALTFVGAISITPVRSEGLTEDLFKHARRYITKIVPPAKEALLFEKLRPAEPAGARPAREEGRFGREDAQ